MASVCIRFDLEESEEVERLELWLKAREFVGALHDLDEHLRGKLKYQELTDDQTTAYQDARDKLHEIVEDRQIPLW